MAESVLEWTGIFNALQVELESVKNAAGDTAFVQVIQGEPLGLPLGGPYACFWYLARTDPPEGRQTFGNIMYAARIQIMAFWVRQPERTTLGVNEADIATIDTNIRRAIRANSIINSSLTDLDILDSQVSYGGFPLGTAPQLYRALEMELRLDNLEGEARVP